MANRYNEMQLTYMDEVNNVTKDVDSWKQFLEFSSNHFKYSFKNKLLIYNQNPEAIAVATMDDWNKKAKRWIIKGSTSIVIFDDNKPYGLKYVFDVKDTHHYNNRYYNLWKYNEKYKDEIIDSLESSFGELTDKNSMRDAIINATMISIDDNLSDYFEELKNCISGSKLENLSDIEIQTKLKEILLVSCSYMTLKRCGLNAELNESYFENIYDFDKQSVKTILGQATSDIADNVITEIRDTIYNLQKEEKIKNRTFEIQNKINYNLEKENGGNENEVSKNRGLSISTSNNERTENSKGQIRTVEANISNKEQAGDIHESIDEQRTNTTSTGNTENSDRESRENNTGSSKTKSSERTDERKESNAVGTDDEYVQTTSRRTSGEGVDLQLEKSPPLNDTQISIFNEQDQIDNIIEEVENENSTFSFSQEEINEELKRGSGFEKGKFRIYEFLSHSMSNEDSVKFLKQEYGIGGHSLDDGGFESHSAKGITLERGNKKLTINWNEVAKRITNLMLDDNYFSKVEFEQYVEWLEEKQRENKIAEIKKNDEEPYKNLEKKPIKEDNNKKYFYRVGDTTNIDGNEYIIERIGKTSLWLQDPRYPLFGREMNIEDFEKKLFYSIANDYMLDESRSSDEKEGKLIDIPIKENVSKEEQQEEIDIASENKIEIPKIQRKTKTRLTDYVLHPEVPIENRLNYNIDNNDIGEGTPKERFKNNINAIKVLKKCENENRYASKEEQEILSKYVGWGGLQDCFDVNKDNWHSEYEELKSLLDEDEYKKARESTLTAFYTPPIVTKAIFKSIQNMGLSKGNILEPACGIGNFMGAVPRSLENCKIYGVELDSISGRIAQQLYQKNTIAVQGYEKTDLPNAFFDVAVGNVPFGDFKVLDKKYNKNNFLIHDYFFAKTLDKVRPRRSYCIYYFKRYNG